MHSQDPAPTIVASNEWADLLLYEKWKTVDLKWRPSSKGMTDDEVKATLKMFADSAEQLRPTFLMSNAVEFFRGFNDDIAAYRAANVIPAYNRAGIKKFVLIVREGTPGTVESGEVPAAEKGANFPTAWFSSLEHAYDWLAS